MRSRGSAAKSAKDRAAAITSGEPASKPKPEPKPEPEQQSLAGVSDEEAADAAAKPKPRVSSTADPSELSMGAGHDRIIDTLFDMPDPFEEYQAVKASLRLGTKASRADYGTLVDALDQAEQMAERAFALLINAKVSRDAFEIDAKAIEGGMREQATAALQAEKDKGERKKAITEKDVDAYMAAQFPDEFRDLETRRGKARRTVSYLENLSYRASERAKDLRQMVARARDA